MIDLNVFEAIIITMLVAIIYLLSFALGMFFVYYKYNPPKNNSLSAKNCPCELCKDNVCKYGLVRNEKRHTSK